MVFLRSPRREIAAAVHGAAARTDRMPVGRGLEDGLHCLEGALVKEKERRRGRPSWLARVEYFHGRAPRAGLGHVRRDGGGFEHRQGQGRRFTGPASERTVDAAAPVTSHWRASTDGHLASLTCSNGSSSTAQNDHHPRQRHEAARALEAKFPYRHSDPNHHDPSVSVHRRPPGAPAVRNAHEHHHLRARARLSLSCRRPQRQLTPTRLLAACLPLRSPSLLLAPRLDARPPRSRPRHATSAAIHHGVCALLPRPQGQGSLTLGPPRARRTPQRTELTTADPPRPQLQG